MAGWNECEIIVIYENVKIKPLTLYADFKKIQRIGRSVTAVRNDFDSYIFGCETHLLTQYKAQLPMPEEYFLSGCQNISHQTNRKGPKYSSLKIHFF